MDFITDHQTLEDLNLLGKFRKHSVFSLFNKTITLGGELLMEQFFQYPLTDIAKIKERARLISFFRRNEVVWPFSLEDLKSALDFAKEGMHTNMLGCIGGAWRKKALQLLGVNDEAHQFIKGVKSLAKVMIGLKKVAIPLYEVDQDDCLKNTPLYCDWLVNTPELTRLFALAAGDKGLTWQQVAQLDYYFRHKYSNEIHAVFEMIYHLDVYTAIAQVANAHQLVQAEVLESDSQKIFIEEVFHPCITHAVGNTIDFGSGKNLIFLTGANMAGKSTYMKSFGIAIYLAHMGFPVAARSMQFAIRDGLYSSINVTDNLDKGYSHYYAEVLRVKKVAEAVAQGHKMVVIFDELFKGTNVKDAFEATWVVTEAFQQHRQCQYMISTHIVEVGEELKKLGNQVTFRYMPTIMDGHKPTYTYRAQEGISSDKHGMLIIHNEGVLELLEKSKTL